MTIFSLGLGWEGLCGVGVANGSRPNKNYSELRAQFLAPAPETAVTATTTIIIIISVIDTVRGKGNNGGHYSRRPLT